MRISRVALSVRVEVYPADLDQHASASARAVGEALAAQVDAHVQTKRLGYYPALDYFSGQSAVVDPELLQSAEGLVWLASRLVRDEVRQRLRPVFASLRFDAMQGIAFTMPTARPGQAGAYEALVAHYTPNVVRMDLTASVMLRDDTHPDITGYAAQLVHRWLGESFGGIMVSSSRQLD